MKNLTLVKFLKTVAPCKGKSKVGVACGASSTIVEINKEGFVEGICCFRCDARLSLGEAEGDIVKCWNKGHRDQV